MRTENDRKKSWELERTTITVPHVETNLTKTLRIPNYERPNLKKLSNF